MKARCVAQDFGSALEELASASTSLIDIGNTTLHLVGLDERRATELQ
jgi:hypothetical protein